MSKSFRSARRPDTSAGAFDGLPAWLARRPHFEIRPQRYLALDVYYHPYAYADLAGVYEKENRRAA